MVLDFWKICFSQYVLALNSILPWRIYPSNVYEETLRKDAQNGDTLAQFSPFISGNQRRFISDLASLEFNLYEDFRSDYIMVDTTLRLLESLELFLHQVIRSTGSHFAPSKDQSDGDGDFIAANEEFLALIVDESVASIEKAGTTEFDGRDWIGNFSEVVVASQVPFSRSRERAEPPPFVIWSYFILRILLTACIDNPEASLKPQQDIDETQSKGRSPLQSLLSSETLTRLLKSSLSPNV